MTWAWPRSRVGQSGAAQAGEGYAWFTLGHDRSACSVGRRRRNTGGHCSAADRAESRCGLGPVRWRGQALTTATGLADGPDTGREKHRVEDDSVLDYNCNA